MSEEDTYDPPTVLDGITDTVICEVLPNTLVVDLADKKDYTFDSVGEENDAYTINYNNYQDIYVGHHDIDDQLDIDSAETDEFVEDCEGNAHEENGQIFYTDDSKDDKYIIGFENDIKDSTSLTESTEDEKYEFKIEFESTEMASDFDDEINGSSSLTDEEYEFENGTNVIDEVKIINKTTPQMFRPRCRLTVSCKLKNTSRKIKKLEHDVKNLREKVEAINKVKKKKVMQYCKRCKNTISTIPFADDCFVSKNIAPKQLPWEKGDENRFPEDNNILNQPNTMRILREKNNKYNKMHHNELKARKFVAKQELRNALFANLKIPFKFLLSRNLMCTLEQMNYVIFVGDLQAECKKYPYLKILENSSNVYLRKTNIQQVERSVFKIQKSDRVALFQTKSACETFADHYRGNSLAAISRVQIGNKMVDFIQILCRHASQMQMHNNRRAIFKTVPVFLQDQTEVHKSICYENAILDSSLSFRGCKNFELRDTTTMCILHSIQAGWKAYILDYKGKPLLEISGTHFGNEIVNIRILCKYSIQMHLIKNRTAVFKTGYENQHIEVHSSLCYWGSILDSRTTYRGCEDFKLTETHTLGFVRSMPAEYVVCYKGKSLVAISGRHIGKEIVDFIQILCRHVSKIQMHKNKAAIVKKEPEFLQVYREAHESLCVENAILGSNPHYILCTDLLSNEKPTADIGYEMCNFIQILSRRVYETQMHTIRAEIVNQVHGEAYKSIRFVNEIYRNCHECMVKKTTTFGILHSIHAEYKACPVHYKGKSLVAIYGTQIGNKMLEIIKILCRHWSQILMLKNRSPFSKAWHEFPQDNIDVHMSVSYAMTILYIRQTYRGRKDLKIQETHTLRGDKCTVILSDEKIEWKTICMLLNHQQFQLKHRKACAENLKLKHYLSFICRIVDSEAIQFRQTCCPIINDIMQNKHTDMVIDLTKMKDNGKNKVMQFSVVLAMNVFMETNRARTKPQISIQLLLRENGTRYNNLGAGCFEDLFMTEDTTQVKYLEKRLQIYQRVRCLNYEKLKSAVNAQDMEYYNVMPMCQLVKKICIMGSNDVINDGNWIIQHKNKKNPLNIAIRNKRKTVEYHNRRLMSHEWDEESSTKRHAQIRSRDHSVPVLMSVPFLFLSGTFENRANHDVESSHRRKKNRHQDTYYQRKPENTNVVVSNCRGLSTTLYMSRQRTVDPGITESAIINCSNKFEDDVNLLSYEENENVETFVDVTNETAFNENRIKNINETGIVATGIEERGEVHAIHPNTENTRRHEIVLSTPTSDGEHSRHEICTSKTTFDAKSLWYLNRIPFRSRFKIPPAGGSIGPMVLVNTCPIDGFLLMIYTVLDSNIYLRNQFELSNNKLDKLYLEIWQNYAMGHFVSGKIAWCVYANLVSINDTNISSNIEKTVDLFGNEIERIFCVLGQHRLSVERFCSRCCQFQTSLLFEHFTVIPIYPIHGNLGNIVTKSVRDYLYKHLDMTCNKIKNSETCHGNIVQHFLEPPLILAVNLYFLTLSQYRHKSSEIPEKVETDGAVYSLKMVRFFRNDIKHFVDKIKIDGIWTLYNNCKEQLYYFDEDPDGVLLSSCYYVLQS